MKQPLYVLTVILLLAACSKKTTVTESDKKPDAPLTNTRWKLVKLPDIEIPKMADVFIRFYQGKSAGSSGCNRFTGSFSLEGKKLKPGPQAGTRMMCAPEIMKVESAFLKALDDTDGYLISGDHMQLRKGDIILAEFEALYL